ncbi:MAG TPA: BatD family protein [Acidobacteriota bacterium]|nr:BatD family protein [Acidobacteriota bacterium]
MLYRLLCALLLVLPVPAAMSAGISISQSIDKTETAFEDVVHLEIRLSWPGPQSAYLFDQPLNPVFDGFKVTEFSSSVSSTGSGENEITAKTLRFTLAPRSSGMASIQPLTVSYVSWPDSIPGELVTEAMVVTIAERRPTARSESGDFFTLPRVLGGLGVMIVAALVVAVVVRRRKPPVIVKSAREVFLENLSRLRAECGNDLKKLQTGVYKHLTDYLAGEYQLDLANRTADEVAAALEDTNVSQAHREKIVGWLTRAEKEKYSPVTGAPGETVRLEAELREFFEKM